MCVCIIIIKEEEVINLRGTREKNGNLGKEGEIEVMYVPINT